MIQFAISAPLSYNELLAVWDAWRQITAQEANKDNYARYVELANQAAVANGAFFPLSIL